jgi:hypothetical protein
MAVTLDRSLGTSNASGAASVNLVTSGAAAAGTLIVLDVGAFVTGSPTVTVTGTGGLTWATATSGSSGSLRKYLFYAFAPAGLASGTTLTVSAGSGTHDWLIDGGSWLGVDISGTLANALVAFNSVAASTAAWSTGTIAAGAGNLLVAGVFEDGSGTATSTTTAPALELNDFNNATQTEAQTMGYKLSASASDSIAGAWSSALGHVCVGAAFKAAAGAAPSKAPVMVSSRMSFF